MCWEDIKIARSTRTNFQEFIVGVTAVKLLGYDPKRFAIVFGNASAGNLTIGFNSAVQAGRGIIVSTSGITPIYRLILEGDMVRQEFWAISAVANNRITIVETQLAGIQDDPA